MAKATTAAVGSRGSIAVGEEVVYAVPVTPSHRITFTSEAIVVTENSQESEEIRDDRARDKVQRTTLDVSGDISTYIKAAGHGILYKHLLGDYIRIQGADGSIRGRQALPSDILSGGDDLSTSGVASANDGNILVPLVEEATVQFDEPGQVMIVSRNSVGVLELDDAGGPGHDYLGMATHSYAHVQFVDNAYVDGALTIVKITIGSVYDAAGNPVEPSFDENGGFIRFNGKVAPYYYGLSLGGSVDLYLYNDGTLGVPADPASYPAQDTIVEIMSSLSFSPSFSLTAEQDVAGTWYMQTRSDGGWASVWTHHMEAGKELPIGLTVEVDRDAAIFIYTGMQINTWTGNFETGNIANATFGFAGRREYAMATLVQPAIIGDTEIVIDATEAVSFPDPAVTGKAYHVATIGERTDVRYTTLTDNGDGTITLGGIPLVGLEGAIDRFATVGTNVDSRTQTRKTTDLRDETVCSFVTDEILVYQNGEYEEVLNASLTLNNNLNLDKFFLGSAYRAATIAQTRTVEGTLRYEFDDGKHYTRFKEEVYFILEIRCIADQEDAIIEGSEPAVAASATFLAPACRYNAGTPNITSKDSYIEHDMPFDALPDDEYNTIELVMTFVNGHEFDAQDT